MHCIGITDCGGAGGGQGERGRGKRGRGKGEEGGMFMIEKERRGKVCRHKEIRKGKDVEKGLRRE